MTGLSVYQQKKTCLLSLVGSIEGKTFQFLLDSGASCNFVSQATLLALGIDWDLSRQHKVKLADGKVLLVRG